MKINENVSIRFTMDGSVEITEYDEYTDETNKVFLNIDDVKKINSECKKYLLKRDGKNDKN